MNSLFFYISEAVIGMKRSIVMMLISVITITISLFIFGVFLLISLNLNNIANSINSNLEIKVFLKETVTKTERSKFKQAILKLDHVKKVNYTSKNIAWKKFVKEYPHLNLDNLFENSPLPNSFTIGLDNNQYILNVVSNLKTFKSWVEKVSYGGIIAERMQKFSYYIKILGLILVIILTIATLFIVVNTIRLTIINRQNEINIMQLVGATNNFIKGPFIIEGILIGILGSLGAVIFLKIAYTFLIIKCNKILPYIPIVQNKLEINIILVSVILLGIILGILGALLSLSKALKRYSFNKVK
ncbi:hypothetical protein DID75_00610 [Candidatus Marinamargulisbacteria bacterium SCGC AG-410-N11]|nr:hypothetical protein DID75_00610 [Candidatus Marinamargulisbacteria bacterium SCGC AG-410-N11]